jgi:zinc D-Ala-D-Ala dipeptidase
MRFNRNNVIIFCFLVFLSVIGMGDTSFGKDLPQGFVDAAQAIPGIVLDIRYFSAHNFVGRPIDGYQAPKCILTRQAAAALRQVQKELAPYSLSLKLYDCYRPQRAVNHFIRWAKDTADTKMKKEFYPTVDKKRLFKDGYIARRSGHSRGSTVDLTIVPNPLPAQEAYNDGQKLCECNLPGEKRFRDNSIDMGTGFDCFHPLSWTDSDGIGLEQKLNRLLLKKAMERHGFKNYRKEWWHYTLIDEPFPKTYFDFVIR